MSQSFSVIFMLNQIYHLAKYLADTATAQRPEMLTHSKLQPSPDKEDKAWCEKFSKREHFKMKQMYSFLSTSTMTHTKILSTLCFLK